MIYKNIDQEYARVIRHLGALRIECECFDGITRQCIVRKGKMANFQPDDIVLVSLRDIGKNNEADIIYLYDQNEVKLLQKENEIPTYGPQNELIIFENTDNLPITEETSSEEEINFDDI